MKVWLKHREVFNNTKEPDSWEYELVDLDVLCEDYGPNDPVVGQYDQENLEASVMSMLREDAASVAGDRYFGSNHEFTLVYKPSKEWLDQELDYAAKRLDEAQTKWFNAHGNMREHYPQSPRSY